MKLFILFLISLFFQLPAEGAESCSTRLAATCSRLRAASPGVTEVNADGTISVNPLSNTSQWSAEHRRYFRSGNINRQNFNDHIKPAFEQLKRLMIARLETSSDSVPFKRALINKIRSLQLTTNSHERCERRDRSPINVNYDGNAINMCPMLTHMSASALVSVMAHELGHAVDLCDDRTAGWSPAISTSNCGDRRPAALNGFVFAGVHCCSAAARVGDRNTISFKHGHAHPTCGRHNEVHADYVGTQLMNDYLSANTAQFPQDSAKRLEHYAFYRLSWACDPKQSYPAFERPLFQSRAAQSLLNCQGIQQPTACTDEEIALPPLPGNTPSPSTQPPAQVTR